MSAEELAWLMAILHPEKVWVGAMALSTFAWVEGLLFVGWLDILAMGLFAGAWMVRRAVKTDFPHTHLLLCLFVTFTRGNLRKLVEE